MNEMNMVEDVPLESLSKKLQMLQRENNTLRQEREDFEVNIRKYVMTIGELDEDTRQLKRHNQQLNTQVREKGLQMHKLENQHERLTHQYRILYQRLNVDSKRGAREVVIREIQLNNQLNDIHAGGFQRMVATLKEQLAKKNQDIVELSSECATLKKNLLQSTYEYNETIAGLKEQVMLLKSERSQKMSGQGERLMGDEVGNKLVTERVDGLERQLRLCEREYKSLSKELLESKKDLNHYKFECQWLKISHESEKIQSEMVIDIKEMNKLVEENVGLKRRLDQEIQKFSTLIRNNPELFGSVVEVDLVSPMEQLQQKYDKLLKNSSDKEMELAVEVSQMANLQAKNNLLQEEHLKFRALTVKSLDKLKGILRNYVPCLNYYGFEEFGLQPEECKFIAENDKDIYKEYDRISAQLLEKTIQIRKLEGKVRELEKNSHKLQQQNIKEVQSSSKLREQNQKLVASVEALMERAQESYSQSRISMDDPFQQPQANEQEPLRSGNSKSVSPMDKSHVKARVEALGELAADLFQKYQKSVSIIRQKDAVIAEANAELKIFRSECKAKVISFQTFQLPVYSAPISSEILQADIIKTYLEEYSRLRGQLASMSELYQKQLVLLDQQHQNKFGELSIKYADLLGSNKELHNKFSMLEKLYDQSLEKKVEGSEGRQESVGEQIQMPQGVQLQPRDDRNVISEATIQIINDLLKKYQKQVTRFTSLYQSQMLKTKQFTLNKQHQPNNQLSTIQLQDKIRRVEQILAQNQLTIDLLQRQLNLKEEEIKNSQEVNQQQIEIRDDKVIELERCFNEVREQLENIKNQQTSSQGNQDVNGKSGTFLMTIINNKNQQITSLKQRLRQRQRQIGVINHELVSLKSKVEVQESELEREEYQKFKTLVDGDLTSLLQRLNNILVEKKQQPQPHQEEAREVIEEEGQVEEGEAKE